MVLVEWNKKGVGPGKQSPIQSQFEQSLLTVQNVAQRTFSLLFPLLRLGRSAQISCAVRGPICDLISTDGSVSDSIVSPFVSPFVWSSTCLGVRTICPTPNREGNDMIWECRIQRKGERVEGVGVRTCVGVGGRVNKNIWAKGYQNVYVFNFNMSPHEMQGLNTTCLSDQKGWFHFSIVTAHKFFVLPNNHPFNHNSSKACSQCRT